MGGLLLLVAALLLAIWAAFQSNQPATLTVAGHRPTIEAVAANMMEMHRAAVDFVKLSANRNPVSGNWAWNFSSHNNVLCSGSYPANSVAGSCTAPTTELRLPSFLANIYNWEVYYTSDGAGGAADIVVTYAALPADMLGGYSSTQVARALASYAPAEGWLYGVTTATSPPTLPSGSGTQNLPIANQGVVALATIIP